MAPKKSSAQKAAEAAARKAAADAAAVNNLSLEEVQALPASKQVLNTRHQAREGDGLGLSWGGEHPATAAQRYL